MSVMEDETIISQSNLRIYKYTPLKSPRSIRVLHLHPAESYELPIRVSLFDFSLDACANFIALSYTWATEDGDSSLTKAIGCASDGLYINITPNCDAALRRIRAHSGKQGNLLWIDAICIDQNNVEEKNLQVPLMNNIYKQAERVLLWIGEASSIVDSETSRPITDLGMEFINKFAQEIQERKKMEQNLDKGDCYQAVLNERQAIRQRKGNSPYVQGLWEILHRGWWKRVWVVQEAAIAHSPILLCGTQLVSFAAVEAVIDALAKDLPGLTLEEHEFNAEFITVAFPHFVMRDYVKRVDLQSKVDFPTTNIAPGHKALHILNYTHQACASDPRDKIYGISGFFGDPESDPENILPRPDYSKSTAEVYADVTRAIIVKTKSLSVMSHCYGRINTNPGLPSWAKSYDHNTLNYFDDQKFNAANDSLVVYEDCADNFAFKIKGKRVDTIKEVISLPNSEHFQYGNLEIVTLWRQWCDFAFTWQSYPTGEDMARVFLETLSWSSNALHNRLAPGEYQDAFDALLPILTSDEPLEKISKELFEHKVAYPYCNRASKITLGRLLCKTSNSYLALVPLLASPGDQIVIFSGGRIPFVIQETGDTFKLLGPCYIHGIMDGQAFPKGESGCEKLNWFTLR
jgi:hypothetical protein